MRRTITTSTLIVLFYLFIGHASVMASSTEADRFLQSEVSGSVIDAETGETMPGVNVAIENSTRGTATDLEGNFSLGIDDPETVLVFSFVGYETLQVTVGDREEIHVELVPDLGRLDEVIVVGYGTVRRSD